MNENTTYLNSAEHYSKLLNNAVILKPAEIDILVARFRNGDERAIHDIVLSNIKWVHSIASNYRSTCQGSIQFLDLTAEGLEGLLIAVKKYDIEAEATLSTYARNWIQWKIEEYIMKYSKGVKVPMKTMKALNKYNRARTKLSISSPKEVTPQHLAEHFNEPVEDVKSLLAINTSCVSIDEPINDSDGTLSSLLVSDSCNIDELMKSDVLSRVFSLLDELEKTQPKQSIAVKMKFGIEDGVPKKLHEIGRVVNLSGEGARQAIKKGLKFLENKLIDEKETILYD